ncbi:hypothetical protein FRX31_014008 [Thalictrum thalictroides]|uniref:Reverse transcriptase zinc-binding domain-containing protein n=1 Tax=Thalictrum thalictroides TaxID=46969 RepID=A0A7J6WG47_THATH|nr:hypothetical protein FRX31_014008 [Thalictrum thalictroides]
MWDDNEEGGHWQFQFRRNLRDWEIPMIDALTDRIGDFSFSENEDSWLWVWSKKGSFTVRSMYKFLTDEKFDRLGSRQVFPSSLVWGTDFPMNIKCFFWSLFLGKILTRPNLVHKGFDISSLCPFCNLLPESTVHLFLHCLLMLESWTDLLSSNQQTLLKVYEADTVVLELWTDLLSSNQQTLLKVYEADTVVDLFSNWPVKSGNDLMVRVWKYLPYAAAWVTWKHRNNKVFNKALA